MMSESNLWCPAVRAAGVITVAAVLIGIILLKRRRPKLEARAKVTKLVIYPIKSVPGIEVDHLEVHDTTLKYKNIYDRHWMLIDQNGHALRLLDAPKLAQINVSYDDGRIRLQAPNMPLLYLTPIEEIEPDQLLFSTKLWGESIDGLYAGDQPSEWFAKFLSKPSIRLLQYHAKLKQTRRGEYVKDGKMTHSELNPIRFQDSSPCLLLNEASWQDLINRVEAKARAQNGEHVEQITYDRFRPNVLAHGFEPFAEDRWTYVQIGSCLFEVRVACGRCRMTTLDTKTIEFGEEPLRTLREYRMGTPGINGPNTPVMGTYIQNMNDGIIRVGDVVSTDK